MNANSRALLFALAVLVLGASPARAFSGFLLAGGGGQYVQDSQYDVFADSRGRGRFNLRFGFDVIDGLAIYGGYGVGATSGNFSDLSLLLANHDLEAGARYHYPILSFVDLVARAGPVVTIGVARAAPAAEADAALTDTAGAIGGQVALGFDFVLARQVLRKWRGFDEDDQEHNGTFGAGLEAGYQFCSTLVFDELTPVPLETEREEARRLAAQSVDLGEVNLSGFFITVAAIWYF